MENITALVLSHNERENIRRTLQGLSWLPNVIVLDSYSSDETLEIARTFRNVEVRQRPFDTFAGQCNWGLSKITSDWVLSLDADYVVTPELAEEIKSLPAENQSAGYSARFKYCIAGIPLRSTLLPPRTILYRRTAARYEDEGHGHRVRISGESLQLSGYVLHDDRKPLSRWLQAQDKYMKIEAPHLLSTPDERLSLQDRLRKRMFLAPPIIFLYLLFARGLILDGWPGWYYVAQRTLAELLLSLRLLTERESLEHGEQM